jgi:hypothetical protein
MVVDFEADEEYYIERLQYFTDDLSKLTNVTIEYGDSFDSTDLNSADLSIITGGVESEINTVATCFRVTHSINDISVVYANQFIVAFQHDKVDWGSDGTTLIHDAGTNPAGEYGDPSIVYLYNDDLSTRTAQVYIPDNDFGNYIEISTDGNSWVGKGEYITIGPISSESSESFYLRTNVPEGSQAGQEYTGLIFARWQG